MKSWQAHAGMVVLVCAAVTQWNGAALAELGGACRLDGVVCWQRGGAVCVCVQQSSGRWERAKLGEVPCHKCTHVTVTVCPWFVFRCRPWMFCSATADDESDGKNISCCLYFENQRCNSDACLDGREKMETAEN